MHLIEKKKQNEEVLVNMSLTGERTFKGLS